ncbi:MAG: hypothetical protein KDA87_01470 [Planctomycetales bacterium]|nr:hypothetical protein [Planctomycetales bacterium]
MNRISRRIEQLESRWLFSGDRICDPDCSIAFVGDFSNGTSATDASLISHLRAQEFNVLEIDDSQTTTINPTDVDLIFISESVSSGRVGASWRDTNVPMIVSEPWLYDDYGLTEPAELNFGSDIAADINIVTPNHPVVDGFSVSTVPLNSQAGRIGWGVAPATATVIATLANDPDKDVWFAFKPGDTLANGLASPHYRLAVSLWTPLTAASQQLLDNSLDWILSASTGSIEFAEHPPSILTVDQSIRYSLNLSEPPASPVTIHLQVDASLTVFPASLEFTSSNWSVPQPIQIAVASMTPAQPPAEAVIRHQVQTTDEHFAQATVEDIRLTIIKPTSDLVRIIESNGETLVRERFENDSYSVVLNERPTAAVTIQMIGDAEVAVSRSSLTFTRANWNVPQTVAVSAIADNQIEGSHLGTIQHQVQSADPTFDGLQIQDVRVRIEPIRMVFVGDSITQGDHRFTGFRYLLWRRLIDEAVEFDFVGTQTTTFGARREFATYQGLTFDPDHEAYWGLSANAIRDLVAESRAFFDADVAIVHLGSNDLLDRFSVESTLEDVRQTLELLREDNPQMEIFLAQLIPTARDTNALIDQFNRELPAQVAEWQQSTSPIYVVDQYTDMNAIQDLSDGVHPNDTGEVKMTNRWFDALTQRLAEAPPTLQAFVAQSRTNKLGSTVLVVQLQLSRPSTSEVQLQYQSGNSEYMIARPVQFDASNQIIRVRLHPALINRPRPMTVRFVTSSEDQDFDQLEASIHVPLSLPRTDGSERR